MDGHLYYTQAWTPWQATYPPILLRHFSLPAWPLTLHIRPLLWVGGVLHRAMALQLLSGLPSVWILSQPARLCDCTLGRRASLCSFSGIGAYIVWKQEEKAGWVLIGFGSKEAPTELWAKEEWDWEPHQPCGSARDASIHQLLSEGLLPVALFLSKFWQTLSPGALQVQYYFPLLALVSWTIFGGLLHPDHPFLCK